MRKKYSDCLNELVMMKLFSSSRRPTEKMAFFYNSEDLPRHVQDDLSLLEEWKEVLYSDGVVIADQVHGTH